MVAFSSKSALVTKLSNEDIFEPQNVHCNYIAYQSSTVTLKQLTEWSKDEPHWMSWLSESVAYDLLNYLLIFVSCKMLCNHLLTKKKENITEKSAFSSRLVAYIYIHSRCHSQIFHQDTCAVLLSVIRMMPDTVSCLRRSGWRGEDYVCKGPAVPNPSNFKKGPNSSSSWLPLFTLLAESLKGHWIINAWESPQC